MGKKGIFEYLNLQKKELISKNRRPYTKIILVSDKEGSEAKKEIANYKLRFIQLGFKVAMGGVVWAFGNQLEGEKGQKIFDALKEINEELKAGGGSNDNFEVVTETIAALKAKIDAATIPIKTKTELQQSLEVLANKLANAESEGSAQVMIDQLFDFSRKFHTYSFENVTLIYAQDPEATQVAGRRRWEKDFNRNVVDLDKAITINCGNKWYLTPNGQKKEYGLTQQRDDKAWEKNLASGLLRDTPQQIAKRKSEMSMRRKIIDITFDPCVVFDIANTTGEDVPQQNQEPDTNVYSGDDNSKAEADKLFAVAKKSLESDGISVTQDPATASEVGWSRNGQINVSSNITGTQAVSVIFSEWAHDLLHHTGGKFYQEAEKYFRDKGDNLTNAQIEQIRNVQEKTIAAVLCKHYGLPSEFHPKYMELLNAQGGLNSKQLILENLGTIRDVAAHIVKQVNYNGAEFNSQPTQEPINESKKKAKDSLLNSKSISKELKELISKYMLGGSTYSVGGYVRGLSKPEVLRGKSKKINGVSMGADKNGFYVYTHRARSKSHPTPDGITVKEIEFIESTG